MRLKEKYLKVLSVNIRHYFKGIIIPSNKRIFHKREGLPLKVSVESYLEIIIQCSHEKKHNFKIPIEPLIKWKIANGLQDGVFKHGYGLNAKYSDTDNENCVVYYPGIRGTKDDYKDKDIPISIRISTSSLKGLIESFLKDNLNEDKRILLMDASVIYLLILHLKQKQGFLNKMYYESSITVKQASQKELDLSNNQDVANNQNDEDSIYMYSFDKNTETFSIENKCVSKCSECKLSINFQFPSSYSIMNPIKITLGTNRILSSEYVKISNSISEYVYTAVDRPELDFDIKNNNENVDKFRINNCPVIRIKETSWTSTAGAFPCGGGNSNSVIYYSLDEKELSKSPITFKLYERNLYEQNDDEETRLIDERKFWIVRKAIMGG